MPEHPRDDSVAFRELRMALERMGLLEPGERANVEPLAGGVSSDISRVDLRRGAVCVKRALPKLRVSADWYAPVERNAFEVTWIRTVAAFAPEAVVPLLGEDRESGLFVMEYLPPHAYPEWKSELRDGRIDPAAAAQLGALTARIHGTTSAMPELAEVFAGADPLFRALRMEPYFLSMIPRHPECAAALTRLVATTTGTRRALVHGDLSPKNVLLGPNGPVLLDAETAHWGDPAFDVAFCLNHLLLKCLWRPAWQAGYLDSFRHFWDAYRAGIGWEPVPELEARVSALLAGLLLARVDGKSPVEYLVDESDRARAGRARVRRVAIPLLLEPVGTLQELLERWKKELQE